MPTVGPITETRVPIVYDTDTGGFGGPGNMDGPVVGHVLYSQASGDLDIKVVIDYAQPSTTYEVFLVCGPAHGMGCGFVSVGTVTTNAVGAGSAGITVPFPVLVSPPFGPGYRTDHLDILQGVGDLSKGSLTAGAINYFVCRRENYVEASKAERTATVQQSGDPFGEKAHEGDPGGAPRKGEQ